MADLVAWLTQILDEDEKAADRSGGGIVEMQNDDYGRLLVSKTWVLADIEAKRAIIARYDEVRSAPMGPDAFANGNAMARFAELEWVLKIHAATHSARPGYDEAWKP